jgi:hypothetical protein
MQQTKVTDKNRIEFYKTVYPVLQMSKNELINLDLYPGVKVIFDSAGWHYQQNFPNQIIVKIENIQTCKEYQLPRYKFDKIFTGENIPKIEFTDPTLIIDYSNYMKYKTPEDIKNILLDLSNKISPDIILFRLNLVTVNDNRLTNRIENFINITPTNFVISEFNFFVEQNRLFIKFIKKKIYDLD